MDEKQFMIFLQRILENANNTKCMGALNQLKKILDEQKAPEQIIELLEAAIFAYPEAREVARSGMVNAEKIKIAKERAKARMAREAQMNHYRGCR